MSSSAEALSHPGTGTHAWNRRARFFNSGNAFALDLSPVPSVSFIAERDRAFDPAAPSGLIDMDLSAALKLPFPATTPLVLSRYAVMVTPPDAAHSHHNEGSRRMESWVVQDGGLHYHARTTGFAYAD